MPSNFAKIMSGSVSLLTSPTNSNHGQRGWEAGETANEEEIGTLVQTWGRGLLQMDEEPGPGWTWTKVYVAVDINKLMSRHK